MGNRAINVSEQIETLKRRGMTINNEAKAEEVLLDVGYYRLGFYWFPFEKSYPDKERRTHEFREGTNFDNIVKLYYFDFKLRNLLQKYLNRIEINFRTYLTYYVSTIKPDSPTWFADPSIVTSEYVRTFDNEVYTPKFKRNPVIKRHHAKHINDKYAPAWKTIEFMTLGAIIILFRSIQDKNTRLEICGHFGIKWQSVFDNYMNIILRVRNICAHGSVLYDFAPPKSIKKGPAGMESAADYQNLNGAIHVILYMLGCVSKHRQQDLKDELNQLLDQYKAFPEVCETLKMATGIKKNM